MENDNVMDELLGKAVLLAARVDEIDVGVIQREFVIGYERASKILCQLRKLEILEEYLPENSSFPKYKTLIREK